MSNALFAEAREAPRPRLAGALAPRANAAQIVEAVHTVKLLFEIIERRKAS